MAANSATQLLLKREECLEIIKNYLQLKDQNCIILKNYKVQRCSSDLLGFMGEYYKLKVEVEVNKNLLNLSYFVKSVPLNDEIYRDECERKGFFVKESFIYQNILPNIQRYCTQALYPKAFLTRKDLMVLEDFSLPEKRLQQLELHSSYTELHFKLFLKHLAQLHAASLAWEIKENVNIGEQFGDMLYELQLINSNEWYITGIKAILYLAQQHPSYQYPEALDFINLKLYNILLNMEEYTKPSKTLRNVLCHRDSWDRNIFWQLNEQNEAISCRIVDFQLTRYSPPAIDVLYFLYNNFQNPQQRSKLLPQLLTFYFENLKENIKLLDLPSDLITEKDFDYDCQRALLPVLTLRAICEPLMKLPAGWSQKMRKEEPETIDRYMNSDRREMFARVTAIDPLYLNKVLLPVQELLEYFELKPQL